MSVAFVDNINSMSCYPKYAGDQDVVFQVMWTRSGTDGTFNASSTTVCNLPARDVSQKSSGSFIPYDQLTQEIVLGWIYGATSKETLARMSAEIEKSIADQAAPPVVTPPLPWNVSAPVADAEPTP